MVLVGAKRYNHDYVDNFQLALDFECRHSPYLHHQDGNDVGTPCNEDPWMGRLERGGDDITDWHSGTGMYYDSIFFPGSSFTDNSLSQPDQALRYSAYSPQR